jgi:hypothetical protein
MTMYVLAYRAPKGYERSSTETTPAWFDWFDELGDRVVDLGRPVEARATLGAVDAEATELGGYSVIAAGSLDEAVRLAAGCPFLSRGGGIEVGELAEVPARVSTG